MLGGVRLRGLAGVRFRCKGGEGRAQSLILMRLGSGVAFASGGAGEVGVGLKGSAGGV